MPCSNESTYTSTYRSSRWRVKSRADVVVDVAHDRDPHRRGRAAHASRARCRGTGSSRRDPRGRAPRSRTASSSSRPAAREPRRAGRRGAPPATCRTGRRRPRDPGAAASVASSVRHDDSISSAASIRPMRAAALRTHVGSSWMLNSVPRKSKSTASNGRSVTGSGASRTRRAGRRRSSRSRPVPPAPRTRRRGRCRTAATRVGRSRARRC